MTAPVLLSMFCHTGRHVTCSQIRAKRNVPCSCPCHLTDPTPKDPT